MSEKVVTPKDAVRSVRRVVFEFEVSDKSAGVGLDNVVGLLRSNPQYLKSWGIEYISSFDRYDYGDGFKNIFRTLKEVEDRIVGQK